MAKEKIFEIKIVSIANMPEVVKKDIIRQVSQKESGFQKNYKGFAKITYVTASPKSIQSIEPIQGTIIDYFETSQKQGVVPVF